MGIFREIFQAILDFIFPKRDSVLNLESLPAGELLRILPPAEDPIDKDAIALFDYKHPLVRELVWELKYGGNRVVAEKLGGIVYDFLCDELADRAIFEKFSSPVLVPMPISDKRRYERGWNQSELLLDAVKKCDKQSSFKYLPRQLVKYRHTESQTRTASKHERLDNLKNSMRVLNPATVEGRCVVLIDDVLTTGATFKEAKRALREAGAKKIICIALAH